MIQSLVSTHRQLFVACELATKKTLSPQKAIYRMLTWATGTFELEPGGEMQVMEEIQESAEALLMEGVRQLDEFQNLKKKLPPLGSPLAVPTPLAGKLRDLSPSELDTFQLVLDHGQLWSLFENEKWQQLEKRFQ